MLARSIYARMAIAILALVGFFDSAYLMLSRYQTAISLVCPVTGDGCSTVQNSAWSTIPPGSGVPIALLGIIGYGIVFGVAMAALHTNYARSLPLPALLAALGTLGVIFSIYLIGIQVFMIQAVCSWCMLSALLMITIWLVALFDWRTWHRQTITSPGDGTLSSTPHRAQ